VVIFLVKLLVYTCISVMSPSANESFDNRGPVYRRRQLKLRKWADNDHVKLTLTLKGDIGMLSNYVS